MLAAIPRGNSPEGGLALAAAQKFGWRDGFKVVNEGVVSHKVRK